ncbi:MAG: response regulator [Myxococcaceae bacterium]
MANAEPRILLLDPDKENQRRLAEAFNAGGLFLRYLSEPMRVLQGLKQIDAQLLIIHGEVRSQIVAAALAALSSDAVRSSMPIVLLCNDVSDLQFVNQLRTGIVALLPISSKPQELVKAVHALLAELPTRSGTVQGKGDSPVLANLAEHMRRTFRSGVLTFNANLPNQGRALFVKGTLKSADHRQVSGLEALLNMVTQSSATWTFAEFAGAAGEGAGVVVEIEGESTDEPIVPIEETTSPDGVLVPLEGADEGELLLDQPLSQETAIPEEPSSPTQILLVDDDEELCRMFSLLFRKHGYDVTTATDGFEGFELAQQKSFALVVADLNMPRMDGWGMLRLLRDDFSTRELPVAFLSCHDDYRDSLKALNAGAQAYFSKSTRLDALANKVGALLEPRKKFRAAISSAKPGTAVSAALAAVGAQWLIRELCDRNLSCRVDASDGWASYQIFIRNGRPVHATAMAGRHKADGERAFNAFIASRVTDAIVHLVDDAPATTLLLPANEQLARTAATLTENERKLREGLLVNANDIQVDPDLYAVYAQVGPKQWLETARLICEERLPPREVIARVEASPLDVEETLKDLLRRGIVRLTA